MFYGGLRGQEPPRASLSHHAGLKKELDYGATTFRRRTFVDLHNSFVEKYLRKNSVPFIDVTDAHKANGHWDSRGRGRRPSGRARRTWRRGAATVVVHVLPPLRLKGATTCPSQASARPTSRLFRRTHRSHRIPQFRESAGGGRRHFCKEIAQALRHRRVSEDGVAQARVG